MESQAMFCILNPSEFVGRRWVHLRRPGRLKSKIKTSGFVPLPGVPKRLRRLGNQNVQTQWFKVPFQCLLGRHIISSTSMTTGFFSIVRNLQTQRCSIVSTA